MSQQAAEPQLSVRQKSAERDRQSKLWRIYWEVTNLAAPGLEISSVRLPHGQFKAEELRAGLTLSAGESAVFQTMVRCVEPAGLVTENAFVIFYCHWHGEAWRVFVRIRVVVGQDGEPNATTELITTQRAGFSGVVN